jgi:hypothetical protein
MVRHQYLYLVHPGRLLALRKAQNVLVVDFPPELLDRILDPTFLRERIVRAPP